MLGDGDKSNVGILFNFAVRKKKQKQKTGRNKFDLISIKF